MRSDLVRERQKEYARLTPQELEQALDEGETHE